jgi:CRP-like cAMP-binding protein
LEEVERREPGNSVNFTDATAAKLNSTEVLAHTAFFAELSAEQRERVARLVRMEEHPQDACIYSLGDVASDFYVLVDGMVRFTIGLGSRRTHAGQILRRGEVFGWAALVESAPKRIAAAQCITPCTVLAIRGDQLLILMDHDHSLGYRIMKQLNVLITGNLTAFASG